MAVLAPAFPKSTYLEPVQFIVSKRGMTRVDAQQEKEKKKKEKSTAHSYMPYGGYNVWFVGPFWRQTREVSQETHE